MKLSDKILALRKARQMSQEELAEKLGVSRQAVSRWEGGSSLPDASNIFQLSKLFGVTADYLLNDEVSGESATGKGHKKSRRMAATVIKKIVALCISAAGLIGNFIIYILSRFIEVSVPFRYHDYDTSGYYYSWKDDYSYRYFIQERHLEIITAVFWLMLIVGLVIVFVPKEKFMVLAGKAKDLIKKIGPKKNEE